MTNNLTDLLNLATEEKNINSEKLAQLTDIPGRFITALLNRRPEQLPAAPYIRGYLLKISSVLDIDGNNLWQTYLKENWSTKRSGALDSLPSNRYAPSSLLNKKVLVGSLIAFGLIVYLILRSDYILGKPSFYLATPLRNNSIVSAEALNLKGRINPGDKLTINQKGIYVVNGEFNENIRLKPGLNTIEFEVSRFLGKKIKTIRQIFYTPAESMELTQ